MCVCERETAGPWTGVSVRRFICLRKKQQRDSKKRGTCVSVFWFGWDYDWFILHDDSGNLRLTHTHFTKKNPDSESPRSLLKAGITGSCSRSQTGRLFNLPAHTSTGSVCLWSGLSCSVHAGDLSIIGPSKHHELLKSISPRRQSRQGHGDM